MIHQNRRGKAVGKGITYPSCNECAVLMGHPSFSSSFAITHNTAVDNRVHNFVLVFLIPIGGIAGSNLVFKILIGIAKSPAKGIAAICTLTGNVV